MLEVALSVLGFLILDLIDGLLLRRFIQRIFSGLVLIFLTVGALSLLFIRPSAWTLVVCYFAIFRIINLVRLLDRRKQADFLKSSFVRSSLVLSICQLVVIGLAFLLNHLKLTTSTNWTFLAAVNLFVILIVGFSLRRTLLKSRPKLSPDFIEDSKLPSITVAIPARNETEDLRQCLSTIVASDYPKMEVLVLDDCSQEKRTPEIIREFAHDGVRFLAGQVPPDSWNAKNFAYQQLLEEANGQIIMFCGVDVRFERSTIRKMIELKIKRHKNMVSYMPLNILAGSIFERLLIQPTRYLWELGLPRRTLNRPPVLSTCWLIDRQQLTQGGGFKAVSRSIIPERYFARLSAKTSDGYSFNSFGAIFGLTTTKKFTAQKETAIRTRYPLLRQRLENVSLVCLVEWSVYVSPIGLFLYGLVGHNLALVILSAINFCLAALIFGRVTSITYKKNLPISFISFPVVFIYDIGLCLYSMWAYEFSVVVWKGRNVCIPVMQLSPTVSSEQSL